MSSTPEVWLSHDRHTMKLRWPNGQTGTFESAREDGFTQAEIVRAGTVTQPSTRIPGQKDRARVLRVGNWNVYVHVNTGPPTWWFPRVSLRGGLMIGWYQALVAIGAGRAPDKEQ